MAERPDYAKPMVGWYDPPQLLRTGALVLVSQQFALHGDNREIQALAAPHSDAADYSKLDEVWIDFVADCGDGWNSTYAVASEVGKEKLELTLDEKDVVLHRGSILIFGGDLVYPTPAGQGYDDRLLKPYSAAFAKPQHRPDVWALPGNHDWYDSLSGFRRLFCTDEDFGPWQSRQRTSYFAIKLPHQWWLFGVDVQLLHDIDHRQLEYFEAVLKQVGEQDRVILVCAEPYWVEYITQPVGSSRYIKSLLQTLREKIGDDRLRLAVAGDLHYYQRLSAKDPQRHLVTCGTGGAFLHPTHAASPQSFPSGYGEEACFPIARKSRRLTRGNIFFLFRNPLFGIVPGFVYLLVAWTTGINIGETFGRVQIGELGLVGIREFWQAIHIGVQSAILSPIGVAIYAMIFAGFIVFTQSKSKMFRWWAGSLHSLAHVLVGFFIFWGVSYICMTVLGLVPKSITQYLIAGALIFPAAWIGGSIVMGLYLWIALNVFGEHANESFSALRVQDWKGFLRMKICSDGSLDIYFVGIERVPRRWKKEATAPEAGGPEHWIPHDSAAKPAKIVDYATIERSPAIVKAAGSV